MSKKERKKQITLKLQPKYRNKPSLRAAFFMSKIKENVMCKNRKGHQKGSPKDKHFGGNAETFKYSKKPFALLKIYHGLRIAFTGFIDLFKRAKQ